MTIHEYLDKHRTCEFKWGERDCFRFVNAWVRSQTGEAFFHDDLSYSNEREALKVYVSECKKRGVSGFVEILNERCRRCYHVPVSGSIVARPDTNDSSVGFLLGLVEGRSAVFLGLDGIKFIPLDPNQDLYWEIR